jgi:hypothetical protein
MSSQLRLRSVQRRRKGEEGTTCPYQFRDYHPHPTLQKQQLHTYHGVGYPFICGRAVVAYSITIPKPSAQPCSLYCPSLLTRRAMTLHSPQVATIHDKGACTIVGCWGETGIQRWTHSLPWRQQNHKSRNTGPIANMQRATAQLRAIHAVTIHEKNPPEEAHHVATPTHTPPPRTGTH